MGALKQRSAKALVAMVATGVPVALIAGGALADVISNNNLVGNANGQAVVALPAQVAGSASGPNAAVSLNGGANVSGAQIANGGTGVGAVVSGDGDVQLNSSGVSGVGGSPENALTQGNTQGSTARAASGDSDAWNDLHGMVTQRNTAGARGTQNGGGNTVGNVQNLGTNVVGNTQTVANLTGQAIVVAPIQVAGSLSGGNVAASTNAGTNVSGAQTATGGAGSGSVTSGGGDIQATGSPTAGTGGSPTNTADQTNDQTSRATAVAGGSTASNSATLTADQSNGGGATGTQNGGDNSVGNVQGP